jgi:hypothetical protein
MIATLNSRVSGDRDDADANICHFHIKCSQLQIRRFFIIAIYLDYFLLIRVISRRYAAIALPTAAEPLLLILLASFSRRGPRRRAVCQTLRRRHEDISSRRPADRYFQPTRLRHTPTMAVGFH